MVYFSFVNIHYIICDCGSTFPTEEELKEHLETEHTNGDILECSSAPITISGKIDSSQRLSNLNEKSVGNNLELVVLDEELEYVQFLDETNQPVILVKVKGGNIKGNREATLSEVNNAFKVLNKRRKIKGKRDIIHDTISRAMGSNYRIQAHYHEPEEVLDQAVIDVKKLSFEQAVAELQRRKERKGYIAASHHCQFCYRHFHTQEQLDEHMLLHNEVSGSFVCAICKLRKLKRGSLRTHVVNQHTRKYSCKICPFTTSYESHAHKHVAFHNGTKHQCPHCSKEFANLTTRESHIRLKHLARHACGLCGYTFLSQLGVRMHRLKIHRFDEQLPLSGPYCEVCDVHFLSQDAYDRHIKLSSLHITDVTNRSVIKNQYQNKPRNTKSEKNKNQNKLKNKNPDGSSKKKRKKRRAVTSAVAEKGPFPCEKCGVELAGLPEYGQHFRQEHPGAVRARFPGAHVCQTCGKLFTHKFTMSMHMRTHAERRFPCERCGRRFLQPGNLRLHLLAHDRLERTPDTFACHICGRHFTLKANLERHIKIHQGIKEFQCEICGKRFSTKVEKTSHVNHVHLKIPRPPRAPRRPRGMRGPDQLRLKISRQLHARKRRPDHEMSGPNHDTEGPNHDAEGPDNDTKGPDHVVIRGPNHIEMNGLDHIDMRGRGHEEMRGPDHLRLKTSSQSHAYNQRPDHEISGPNQDTKGPNNDTNGPDHTDMRGPDHIQLKMPRPTPARKRRPDLKIKGSDLIKRGPDDKMRKSDHIKRGPDHVQLGLDRIELARPDHIQIRGSHNIDPIDIRDFDHIDMLD